MTDEDANYILDEAKTQEIKEDIIFTYLTNIINKIQKLSKDDDDDDDDPQLTPDLNEYLIKYIYRLQPDDKKQIEICIKSLETIVIETYAHLQKLDNSKYDYSAFKSLEGTLDFATTKLELNVVRTYLVTYIKDPKINDIISKTIRHFTKRIDTFNKIIKYNLERNKNSSVSIRAKDIEKDEQDKTAIENSDSIIDIYNNTPIFFEIGTTNDLESVNKKLGKKIKMLESQELDEISNNEFKMLKISKKKLERMILVGNIFNESMNIENTDNTELSGGAVNVTSGNHSELKIDLYTLIEDFSDLNNEIFSRFLTIALNPKNFCDIWYFNGAWYNPEKFKNTVPRSDPKYNLLYEILEKNEENREYVLVNYILNIFFIKIEPSKPIEDQAYDLFKDELAEVKKYVKRDTYLYKTLFIQNIKNNSNKQILNIEANDKLNGMSKIEIEYNIRYFENIKINKFKTSNDEYIFNYSLLHFLLNAIPDIRSHTESGYKINLDKIKNDKSTSYGVNINKRYKNLVYFYKKIEKSRKQLAYLKDIINYEINVEKIKDEYYKLIQENIRVLTYVKERNDTRNFEFTGIKGTNYKNPRYTIDNENIKITSDISFYRFNLSYFNYPKVIGLKDEKQLYYDANNPTVRNFDLKLAIDFVEKPENKNYIENYNLGIINGYYTYDVGGEAIAHTSNCGNVLLKKLVEGESIVIVGNGQSGSGKTSTLINYRNKEGIDTPGIFPCIANRLINPDSSKYTDAFTELKEDNRTKDFFNSVKLQMVNIYVKLEETLIQIEDLKQNTYLLYDIVVGVQNVLDGNKRPQYKLINLTGKIPKMTTKYKLNNEKLTLMNNTEVNQKFKYKNNIDVDSLISTYTKKQLDKNDLDQYLYDKKTGILFDPYNQKPIFLPKEYIYSTEVILDATTGARYKPYDNSKIYKINDDNILTDENGEIIEEMKQYRYKYDFTASSVNNKIENAELHKETGYIGIIDIRSNALTFRPPNTDDDDNKITEIGVVKKVDMDFIPTKEKKWMLKDDPRVVLADVIAYAFDNVREVEPTKNNPNSSRSHILVCVSFEKEVLNKQGAIIPMTSKVVICDLAGVEDKFTCEFAELITLDNNIADRSEKYKFRDPIQDKNKFNSREILKYDNYICGAEIYTKVENAKASLMEQAIYLTKYNHFIEHYEKMIGMEEYTKLQRAEKKYDIIRLAIPELENTIKDTLETTSTSGSPYLSTTIIDIKNKWKDVCISNDESLYKNIIQGILNDIRTFPRVQNTAVLSYTDIENRKIKETLSTDTYNMITNLIDKITLTIKNDYNTYDSSNTNNSKTASINIIKNIIEDIYAEFYGSMPLDDIKTNLKNATFGNTISTRTNSSSYTSTVQSDISTITTYIKDETISIQKIIINLIFLANKYNNEYSDNLAKLVVENIVDDNFYNRFGYTATDLITGSFTNTEIIETDIKVNGRNIFDKFKEFGIENKIKTVFDFGYSKFESIITKFTDLYRTEKNGPPSVKPIQFKDARENILKPIVNNENYKKTITNIEFDNSVELNKTLKDLEKTINNVYDATFDNNLKYNDKKLNTIYEKIDNQIIENPIEFKKYYNKFAARYGIVMPEAILNKLYINGNSVNIIDKKIYNTYMVSNINEFIKLPDTSISLRPIISDITSSVGTSNVCNKFNINRKILSDKIYSFMNWNNDKDYYRLNLENSEYIGKLPENIISELEIKVIKNIETDPIVDIKQIYSSDHTIDIAQQPTSLISFQNNIDTFKSAYDLAESTYTNAINEQKINNTILTQIISPIYKKSSYLDMIVSIEDNIVIAKKYINMIYTATSTLTDFTDPTKFQFDKIYDVNIKDIQENNGILIYKIILPNILKINGNKIIYEEQNYDNSLGSIDIIEAADYAITVNQKDAILASLADNSGSIYYNDVNGIKNLLNDYITFINDQINTIDTNFGINQSDSLYKRPVCYYNFETYAEIIDANNIVTVGDSGGVIPIFAGTLKNIYEIYNMNNFPKYAPTYYPYRWNGNTKSLRVIPSSNYSGYYNTIVSIFNTTFNSITSKGFLTNSSITKANLIFELISFEIDGIKKTNGTVDKISVKDKSNLLEFYKKHIYRNLRCSRKLKTLFNDTITNKILNDAINAISIPTSSTSSNTLNTIISNLSSELATITTKLKVVETTTIDLKLKLLPTVKDEIEQLYQLVNVKKDLIKNQYDIDYTQKYKMAPLIETLIYDEDFYNNCILKIEKDFKKYINEKIKKNYAKNIEDYRIKDYNNIKTDIRNVIRFSQLHYNCRIRRQEGYFINISLKDMQKFISALIFNSAKARLTKNLEANNLLILPKKNLHFIDLNNNFYTPKILAYQKIYKIIRLIINQGPVKTPIDLSEVGDSEYIYADDAIDDDFIKEEKFKDGDQINLKIDEIIKLLNELKDISFQELEYIIREMNDTFQSKSKNKYTLDDNYKVFKIKYVILNLYLLDTLFKIFSGSSTLFTMVNMFLDLKLENNLKNSVNDYFRITGSGDKLHLEIIDKYKNLQKIIDKLNFFGDNLIGTAKNEVKNENRLKTKFTNNNISDYITQDNFCKMNEDKCNFETILFYENGPNKNFMIYILHLILMMIFKYNNFIKNNEKSKDDIIYLDEKPTKEIYNPLLYIAPRSDVLKKYRYENEFNNYYNFAQPDYAGIIFNIMQTGNDREVLDGVKGFGINMNSVIVTLFTVINISANPEVPVNNPPTPPFINTNKLKLIYKTIPVLKKLERDKTKLEHLVSRINSYRKKIKSKILSYNFYAVQFTVDDKTYRPTLDDFGSFTDANNLEKLITYIDSNNAATLIGTVDFEKFTQIRDVNNFYYLYDDNFESFSKELDMIKELDKILPSKYTIIGLYTGYTQSDNLTKLYNTIDKINNTVSKLSDIFDELIDGKKETLNLLKGVSFKIKEESSISIGTPISSSSTSSSSTVDDDDVQLSYNEFRYNTLTSIIDKINNIKSQEMERQLTEFKNNFTQLVDTKNPSNITVSSAPIVTSDYTVIDQDSDELKTLDKDDKDLIIFLNDTNNKINEAFSETLTEYTNVKQSFSTAHAKIISINEKIKKINDKIAEADIKETTYQEALKNKTSDQSTIDRVTTTLKEASDTGIEIDKFTEESDKIISEATSEFNNLEDFLDVTTRKIKYTNGVFKAKNNKLKERVENYNTTSSNLANAKYNKAIKDFNTLSSSFSSSNSNIIEAVAYAYTYNISVDDKEIVAAKAALNALLFATTFASTLGSTAGDDAAITAAITAADNIVASVASVAPVLTPTITASQLASQVPLTNIDQTNLDIIFTSISSPFTEDSIIAVIAIAIIKKFPSNLIIQTATTNASSLSIDVNQIFTQINQLIMATNKKEMTMYIKLAADEAINRFNVIEEKSKLEKANRNLEKAQKKAYESREKYDRLFAEEEQRKQAVLDKTQEELDNKALEQALADEANTELSVSATQTVEAEAIRLNDELHSSSASTEIAILKANKSSISALKAKILVEKSKNNFLDILSNAEKYANASERIIQAIDNENLKLTTANDSDKLDIKSNITKLNVQLEKYKKVSQLALNAVYSYNSTPENERSLLGDIISNVQSAVTAVPISGSLLGGSASSVETKEEIEHKITNEKSNILAAEAEIIAAEAEIIAAEIKKTAAEGKKKAAEGKNTAAEEEKTTAEEEKTAAEKEKTTAEKEHTTQKNKRNNSKVLVAANQISVAANQISVAQGKISATEIRIENVKELIEAIKTEISAAYIEILATGNEISNAERKKIDAENKKRDANELITGYNIQILEILKTQTDADISSQTDKIINYKFTIKTYIYELLKKYIEVVNGTILKISESSKVITDSTSRITDSTSIDPINLSSTDTVESSQEEAKSALESVNEEVVQSEKDVEVALQNVEIPINSVKSLISQLNTAVAETTTAFDTNLDDDKIKHITEMLTNTTTAEKSLLEATSLLPKLNVSTAILLILQSKKLLVTTYNSLKKETLLDSLKSKLVSVLATIELNLEIIKKADTEIKVYPKNILQETVAHVHKIITSIYTAVRDIQDTVHDIQVKAKLIDTKKTVSEINSENKESENKKSENKEGENKEGGNKEGENNTISSESNRENILLSDDIRELLTNALHFITESIKNSDKTISELNKLLHATEKQQKNKLENMTSKLSNNILEQFKPIIALSTSIIKTTNYDKDTILKYIKEIDELISIKYKDISNEYKDILKILKNVKIELNKLLLPILSIDNINSKMELTKILADPGSKTSEEKAEIYKEVVLKESVYMEKQIQTDLTRSNLSQEDKRKLEKTLSSVQNIASFIKERNSINLTETKELLSNIRS